MENKDTDSQKIMQSVIESYTDVRELRDRIADIEEHIRAMAYKILDELKKIEGWEELIDSCRGHYEQYPDMFFGWCEPVVLGTTENPELAFRKGYSNGDDYFVIRLSLKKPLEKQVADRLESIRRKEESDNEKKKKKEYDEYLRLKKKFEN